MTETCNLPAVVPAGGQMDVMTLAQMFVKSGYFTDVKDVAQAVVKIVAGQEVGLGPMASLMGIYIVQGKPSWSANLMATQIRRSQRYDYRINELSDGACELEFFERGRSLGKSRFTMADAKQARLAEKEIWKSYPRNMLFARAMSNGCRWYCADVFGGVTPYTPEELGGEPPPGDLRPEIRDIAPPEPDARINTATGEIVEPAAPPSNGPTTQEIYARRQKLMARWEALWHEAQALGITDVQPISSNAPTDTIVERGKALSALIAERKRERADVARDVEDLFPGVSDGR
jgi:hypothetical protein